MIRVCVVFSCAPRQVAQVGLTVNPGTTVAQAILQSEVAALLDGASLDKEELGIWGRKVNLQQVLRNGDRIEIYRPLKVDPKVARRERFARQGAKTTGLFSKRRPGAKAGY